MSPAVLRRIATVLGLALVLWGGLALWRRSAADTVDGLVLPPLPPASVERITLIRAGDTVALARDGQNWQVNGLPADGSVVAEFLAGSADVGRHSELVSRSAVSHQRLGLDSASALRVTVVTGEEKGVDLFVGSRGPNFEGFYVRRVGQSAAYLVEGAFVEATTRGRDEWRDRRILALAANDIRGVSVRRGAESFLLERDAAGWVVAGRPADSSRAARYLAQFGDVRASGFPAPGQLDGVRFQPPDREVKLLGSDGAVLAALTMAPAENGFWVRTAAGTDYRIDVATANRIAPAAAELVAPR